MKTKVFKKVTIFLAMTIFIAGCSKKGDDHILLTVFDTPNYSVQFGEKPDEVDVSSFMVVKEEGSGEEMNLNLRAIERFSYEKGYEYLLKVKKTLNDDYQYSLIEIISQNQTGELETVVLINVTTERVEWEVPFERMIIQEEDVPWWQTSSFKIEGFEYETGFDYQLKVKKTTIKMPAMSGILNFNLYTLVEIISKTPQM